MARIAGVDLPKDKRIDIGLTYVYGIGRVAAQAILKKAGVDGSIRVKDVSEDKIVKIREVIERDYRVEVKTLSALDYFGDAVDKYHLVLEAQFFGIDSHNVILL